MLKRALFLLAVGVMSIAASNLSMAASGAGANWASHNGGVDETAYSRLDQINVSNAHKLGLAWSLNLPGEVTLEATPLAVNGVLYFTGSHAKVYAVKATTGKVLWTYDPQTWKHYPMKMMFNFGANRGVAYAKGRVFVAALDGRLIALDAKTGKPIWSVQTIAPKSMQTITGAPRVFNGKVIIGQAGADFGARGYVTAYDAATGKKLWRFYTVPGSPADNKGHPALELAAKTWSGKWKKGIGGGAVWDSITYDPKFNRIYLGTANASPYDPEARSPGGGDNLFTASIVALDADTGKYVWHYQINPRDAWDYDSTQQMTLATLKIDGKRRQVLMQAPKNGFLYVIDRKTGKVISAGKIGKVTWAKRIDLKTGRPVDRKDIRYETGSTTIWPAPVGAHSWQAMSYSPKTGLVYIPYMQVGVHYVRGKPQPGGVFVGGVSIKDKEAGPHDGKGALVAWDPVHQKQAWRVWHKAIWNGGVLSTAGNVVFQGTALGYFNAYDATTGKRLWHFNAGLGIIAAPIAYSVNGKEYVSVLVGYGGSAAIWGSLMNVGWKYGAQPRRLLTFALDGKATLPPSPPRDMTVHAVADPSLKINPADVAAGKRMFMPCAVCHGRNLVATGGPGPDLRESKIALHPDSLWAVVHDGALIQRGMPAFPMFTHDQVMDLYAYIREGARKVIEAQKKEKAKEDAKPAGAAGQH